MGHSKNTLSILVIAVLQGAGLFVLHHFISEGVWSYFSPQGLLASYALIILVPTMLMLAWGASDKYKLTKSMTGYMLLVFLMTFYTGTQQTPDTLPRAMATWLPLILTLMVISFIALPFIQYYAGESSVSTPLEKAWFNVSVMIFSWVFVIGIVAVLMLWAALFSVLNIEFFSDLFSHQAFIYFVGAIAQGTGILFIKRISSVVISVNLLIKTLVRLLLILLCFLYILFLLTLPFSGLKPLWGSGGSLVIMILQLLLLVFLGAMKPYAQMANRVDFAVHALVTGAFSLLPLASAISLYGLLLRIDQYGWTVVRFWAVTLWALLAVFTLGYALKIAQKKWLWLDALPPFKVRAAWLVLVLGGLVHSPLLDFRSMTLAAQLRDLEQGVTSLENFDFRYVYKELGKPGREALSRLEQALATTNPEIAASISGLINQQYPYPQLTQQQFVDALAVLGANPLSETETAELYQWTLTGPWQVREAKHYWVLPKDIDGDNQQDWLVAASRLGDLSFWLVYRQQQQWKHHRMRIVNSNPAEGAAVSVSEEIMLSIIAAVNSDQVRLERPRWFEVRMGDITLVVDERHR